MVSRPEKSWAARHMFREHVYGRIQRSVQGILWRVKAVIAPSGRVDFSRSVRVNTTPGLSAFWRSARVIIASFECSMYGTTPFLNVSERIILPKRQQISTFDVGVR
jgi:hypothetical protein